MKFLAIRHLRADSDETQHAHLLWARSTGRLPYRFRTFLVRKLMPEMFSHTTVPYQC